MDNKILAVTISHQLGSGGAYIGEKLAERLGIPFLDRQILRIVARQLDMMEEEVENREERLSTYWDHFKRSMIWADPNINIETPRVAPSDRELFEVECKTIRQIAAKTSAVFMGRCGWNTLMNTPCHVSILLTADHPDRVKRLRELYHLSEQEAQKLIRTNDRERTAYNKNFTKKNWLDARYYDLCLNTSATGWDIAVEIAEKCVRAKIQRLDVQ